LVDRRTGLAQTLGTFDLDADLTALDPAKHNILLGRHKGELRLILTGEDSTQGGIETHRFDVDRVTAASVANGTHLVLARSCYVLRTLLERCGCDCDCDCECGPGTGKDYDRRLNVQFERKLDRAGAEISEGQTHTQNLLIRLPRKAQIEAWRIADYVAQLEPRLPDDFRAPVPVSASSVTYWGRKNPRAALNPTLQICILPVIDSSQTYGDSDMTELVDQVSAKIFSTVDDYYDESSFGELAINFTVFGHDIGGARKPLVRPQAQASYWWEGFRAGGLQAVMPADWTDPVILDGTEAFVMHANPRAGAVMTYDVPFAAMWSSANLGNFPVSLTFDGTETLELTSQNTDR